MENDPTSTLPMADVLAARARLNPDRPALVDLGPGARYTYAELDMRANRTAHFLRQLGLAVGDRVCLLAPNSVVYVDFLFALARLGAVLAPLNWRLSPEELLYIINDCQPSILACAPEYEALLADMRARLDVKHIVAIEGAVIAGAWDLTAGLPDLPTTEPPRPALSGEAPLCILYTSGTTGRPKGAIIPQRQVLWNAINTVVSWGLTSEDVSPIFTPMFHAGGLFVFLTPLLYIGGRLVIIRRFEAEAALQTIVDEACTVVLGVPTLFRIWLDSPRLVGLDFSRVRFFISGGAPCPPEILADWPRLTGRPLRQGYGLTEAGTNCFTMTDDESWRRAGSVGKPIFHSRVRVVDTAGLDVADGAVGELLIQGPHVCAGYWRNAAATALALQDGWFHTGDMARRDVDGYYYIVGRFKDMLISGGENVYAAEVEAVFLRHEAVAEAALIGEPDPKWGEVGRMIVVRRPGFDVTEAELTEFCRRHLARYKVPRRVIFVESLPYSAYGKVIKAELRQRYLD